MPSEETLAFHHAVYLAVAQIPFGKVSTYGHIAYLIGRPQNPRQVGASLKVCHQMQATFPEFANLPWWRVVSSSGLIAKRDGDFEQARRLGEENVAVSGLSVSLAECGWFPDDID